MPELPEVEALMRSLELQTRGRRLERLELASVSALKTVIPPISELVGLRVQGWERRGKYLCLRLDGPWLVIHLARSGWVRWYDQVPKALARPSRGPLTLRVGLSAEQGRPGRPGFDLTEAGTDKRLSLWVVEDPARIDAVGRLGIDPLDPSFDRKALARILAGAPSTIKSALANQSLLAGVGNAYSDEVLHAARLSPFKTARSLGADQVEALHHALVEILGGAVTGTEGLAASQLKDHKRSALRVHGRTGAPCPVCGDTIREVAFATKSLQYCPTCQTGGRLLADRRLSRLLK